MQSRIETAMCHNAIPMKSNPSTLFLSHRVSRSAPENRPTPKTTQMTASVSIHKRSPEDTQHLTMIRHRKAHLDV